MIIKDALIDTQRRDIVAIGIGADLLCPDCASKENVESECEPLHVWDGLHGASCDVCNTPLDEWRKVTLPRALAFCITHCGDVWEGVRTFRLSTGEQRIADLAMFNNGQLAFIHVDALNDYLANLSCGWLVGSNGRRILPARPEHLALSVALRLSGFPGTFYAANLETVVEVQDASPAAELETLFERMDTNWCAYCVGGMLRRIGASAVQLAPSLPRECVCHLEA